ncbi:MAG: hypothetical protein RLZZ450_133 [Pseudomonadota bacterium]|jgi:hypothetical protein
MTSAYQHIGHLRESSSSKRASAYESREEPPTWSGCRSQKTRAPLDSNEQKQGVVHRAREVVGHHGYIRVHGPLYVRPGCCLVD